MIQRPQSLFLLGSLLLMVGAVMLPAWSGTGLESKSAICGAYSIEMTNPTNEKVEILSFYYPAIAGVISALISLISIFKYNDRMLQMKLGMINSLVIAAFVGLVQLVNIAEAQNLLTTTDPGVYEIGFYLPLIAVFLNMFSNRLIKKDEDLVRSVDRIR